MARNIEEIRKRRNEILRYLSQENVVKISDLAAMYGVSSVTMRKDISEMESEGLVIRYHGKAKLADNRPIPYDVRRERNYLKKKKIAECAASLVKTDDSIMLDSGSTTMLIAEQLQNAEPLNIITNSLSIAEYLAKTDHSVTMLGGMLLTKLMCTVGPVTESEIKSIECNKLFLACTGVRGAAGLTTRVVLEASVKKAMCSAAKEVIAVFDDSKFDQAGINLFAEFKDIDTIITTRPQVPTPALEEIEKMGVRIIFADEFVSE